MGDDVENDDIEEEHFSPQRSRRRVEPFILHRRLNQCFCPAVE